MFSSKSESGSVTESESLELCVVPVENSESSRTATILRLPSFPGAPVGGKNPKSSSVSDSVVDKSGMAQ